MGAIQINGFTGGWVHAGTDVPVEPIENAVAPGPQTPVNASLPIQATQQALPDQKARRTVPGYATPNDGTKSFNVLAEAKRRRRWLLGEIKQLRKLEKELAQLERLITAAERPMAAVATITSKTKKA